MPKAVGMTPGELIALRKWFRRLMKECEETIVA
jgi:hypothetical protein